MRLGMAIGCEELVRDINTLRFSTNPYNISRIGLAAGAGMFLLAFVVTLIVSLMQILTHRFAIGSDSYSANRLQFTVKNGYEFNQSLHKQLDEWGVQVTDSKVNRRKDGTTEYDLTVLRRTELTYAEMKAFMEAHEEVLSASNNPIR